jgi:hypothetical protein
MTGAKSRHIALTEDGVQATFPAGEKIIKQIRRKATEFPAGGY